MNIEEVTLTKTLHLMRAKSPYPLRNKDIIKYSGEIDGKKKMDFLLHQALDYAIRKLNFYIKPLNNI